MTDEPAGHGDPSFDRYARLVCRALGVDTAMVTIIESDRQVFLHAGQQGVALFKKQGEMALKTGNDLNHLALNVADGTYEVLKADLEKHGVVVSGRPGEDRCIYFSDPDGHRLQLMVRS